MDWISVDDELPDGPWEVLVCVMEIDEDTPFYRRSIGYYSDAENNWSVNGWFNGAGDPPVAYWMELPFAPDVPDEMLWQFTQQ